jgi:GDP-L-fucose synthase
VKIYVAGHRGLVGSAIVRQIESSNQFDWLGETRQNLDLLDRRAVFQFLEKTNPDAVVVAAAKVGGIGANSAYPVEFLSENVQIQSNLLDAAHAAKVRKVIFLGSSCIYPRLSRQPILETNLLDGQLEPTNSAYAIAKIAGVKLVEAYAHEYGKDWLSLMPTNLYGPGDNFNPHSGHVLPSLVSRMHHAKLVGAEAITLWGTGTPLREFLHVDDLAAAVLHSLSLDRPGGLFNVGSGEEVSIAQLAQLVAKTIGFHGEIIWDPSKPDGTPRKLLDSNLFMATGWSPSIKLEAGIESTYSWFLESNQA